MTGPDHPVEEDGQLPHTRMAPPGPGIKDLSAHLATGKPFERYRILEEIGRGGMGVVYRARDLELEREVALKILMVGPAVAREKIQRFLAEARTIAGLSHPSIVPLFDMGVCEEIPYFTMELVRGRTLEDLVEGPDLELDHRRRGGIVLDVAGALAHAHDRGIVHRDVKPSNIIIGRDGKALLMDFGLARNVLSDQGLTREGTVFGTPQYMSPEQARGTELVDDRSDQYSLGMTLYYLLCGRLPFATQSTLELFDKIVHDDPEPPGRFDPRVPAGLERICMKAIRKDPRDRYIGMAALIEDLERYLDGKEVHATGESRLRRAARKLRRSRGGLFAAGILVAAVVAGAVLLATAPVEESRRPGVAKNRKRGKEGAPKQRDEWKSQVRQFEPRVRKLLREGRTNEARQALDRLTGAKRVMWRVYYRLPLLEGRYHLALGRKNWAVAYYRYAREICLGTRVYLQSKKIATKSIDQAIAEIEREIEAVAVAARAGKKKT